MNLRIEITGSGPDLVLVHGWGLGAAVWSGIADTLAASCRVHRVSLPGYDGSSDGGAGFEATADALAAMLPAGSTLCGWSLGSLLAIAATARHAGHFGKLVLIAATPRFVEGDGWTTAQPPTLLAGFRAAVAADARNTLRRFTMLFNQGDAQARAVSRILTPLLDAPLPATATLLSGLDWLERADLRDKLASVTIPTLLLHGDEDPLMPIAAAEALASALPNARLRHFPGCAHAPFVSAADDFVAALLRFIDEPA